jgi:DNA integrity scanning protein DisA with diadenylate cyclase activity
MARQDISPDFEKILKTAARLAEDVEAAAVILLAEQVVDFAMLKRNCTKFRLIVASDRKEIQEAARQDDVDVIEIQQEPQTRHFQVSQVLLEAIADELLQTGDTVVVVYSAYEKEGCDTISVVRLAEQLAKLTSRDLQRLETKVPLETLRIVVDLACDIGREGREGKPVGTLFVVGNHRKVMEMSQEQVHDPFRGYPKSEYQGTGSDRRRLRDFFRWIGNRRWSSLASIGRGTDSVERTGITTLGRCGDLQSHGSHRHCRLGVDRHRSSLPGRPHRSPYRTDA